MGLDPSRGTVGGCLPVGNTGFVCRTGMKSREGNDSRKGGWISGVSFCKSGFPARKSGGWIFPSAWKANPESVSGRQARGGIFSPDDPRETSMEKTRRGEKLGWSVGWLGAFLWVAVVAVVFLFHNAPGKGVGGLLLFGAAVAVIHVSAPWRHPLTPYWKLVLFPYALFCLSLGWALWAFDGVRALDLNWWNAFWLIPALLPLGLLSKRKWAESDPKPGELPEGTSAPPP